MQILKLLDILLLKKGGFSVSGKVILMKNGKEITEPVDELLYAVPIEEVTGPFTFFARQMEEIYRDSEYFNAKTIEIPLQETFAKMMTAVEELNKATEELKLAIATNNYHSVVVYKAAAKVGMHATLIGHNSLQGTPVK